MNITAADLAIDATGTGELRNLVFSFINDPALAGTDTIASIQAFSQTVPRNGLPALTIGSGTINGKTVLANVSITGGVPGYNYVVCCRVLTAGGQVLMAFVEVKLDGPGMQNQMGSPPVSIGGFSGTVTGPFVTSVIASNGLVQAPLTTGTNATVAISVGTVAGSPIGTPIAQVELGELPRPNQFILKCHPDRTFTPWSAAFNISQSAFANVNNPNRADSGAQIGWNQTSGGGTELTSEAASMIQFEHGFASSLLSVPAQPTVSNSGSGGTVLAGTYQVKITYTIVSSSGETTASTARSTTTSGSTSTITVNSPAAAGFVRTDGTGSAGGYNVYITQAGGSTFTLQNTTPVAIGTNFVLSTPPTSSGVQPPSTNTAALTNDETHLQYVRHAEPTAQRRAWTAFFDWDSGYTSIAHVVDQWSLLRSDNGANFLQIGPNQGMIIGDGVHQLPLLFNLNAVSILQQKDNGGTFQSLARLDANNTWQFIENGLTMRISGPVTFAVGTNVLQLNSTGIGAFNTAPVAQQTSAGNTHTVAAGSTTNVFTNTTFDGGTGSTAYTVGDLVKALKAYGLLVS